MRYTFQQLESAIQEKGDDEAVNHPVEGYPLLMSWLIEYRDEGDVAQRRKYRALLRELFRNKYLQINTPDKHQDYPLHSLVNEHGNEVLKLVKLFLQEGADPNILNRSGKTALELAIERYSVNDDIVKKLLSITEISTELRARCQKALDEAICCYDKSTINNLLESGLAVKPPPYFEDRSQEPAWFQQGVWVRVINNPEKENDILKKRERLTYDQLTGHKRKKDSDTTYTEYSPATFVRSQLPVMTFGFQKPGIIIAQTDRIIPFWYDGVHGEELTEDMRFDRSILTHGLDEGEHHDIHQADIALKLEEVYANYIASEMKNGVDRYGILKDRPFYCSMPWNEGLFRYQRKDILGILIQEQNRSSVLAALCLEKRLMLPSTTAYYIYDSSIGALSLLPCTELIQEYNITQRELVYEMKEDYRGNNSVNNRNISTNPNTLFASSNNSFNRNQPGLSNLLGRQQTDEERNEEIKFNIK